LARKLPEEALMDEIEEVLFDERTISRRVGELAEAITGDYRSRELVVVSLLKGAFLFTADLVRRLDLPLIVEFIQVSSYGSARIASPEIVIKQDLSLDIRDRHVLLVDTIVDTGGTLARLFDCYAERRPASLQAAVLLDKRCRRTTEVPLAYIGFPLADRFVVGYGMDCAERYRNLPYIAALRPQSK
jgi:hypoxanthine phosphoribosyltransferase